MKEAHGGEKVVWQVLLAGGAAAGAALAWVWSVHGAPGYGPLTLGLLCTGVVFLMALLLGRLLAQSQRRTQRAEQLLRSTLDTLEVGLEIWDTRDRLVLYNQQVNRLRVDYRNPADIGQSYETLVRAKLARQEVLGAVGREDTWLAERLASRGRNPEPKLREYSGNQWFRTREIRTPEGFLVTSWQDVTEQVRKERMLQESNTFLTQQTSMDALTGLANRRRFDEVLGTELQRATRGGGAISLLLIDVDHFKRYNDHYGHVAGDECLQRVADVLRRCVRRAGEMVARYGGEEFVILLPGSNSKQATETALNCMEQLRREAIEHLNSPTAGQVTFSMGVASASQNTRLDAARIINAADAAMYHAKTRGRARFEVADQADWSIEKDTPRTRPADLSMR